ncbi:hypothetical protein JG687_00018947, partial [Phytophthora cactorum]
QTSDCAFCTKNYATSSPCRKRFKVATSTCSTSHCGPRTNIVHSPYFESECVRVLGGNADSLTRAEKVVLQPFAVTAPADARESLEEQQDSFVERLRKRRRLYEERSS